MLAIGAYEGRSALSRVIQWMTRSPISHVSVIVLPDDVLLQDHTESGLQEWTDSVCWARLQYALQHAPVYEAWGVLSRPWKGGVFKRHGIHEGHTPGTKINIMGLIHGAKVYEPSVISFLERVVEAKAGYDYMGLIRYALRRKRNNAENWFCSELALAAFRAGGLDLLPRTLAGFASPGDIYETPLLRVLCGITTKGEGQ